MPLIDQNNPEPELQANLASLIDLNEPEALLGTLRHVAQRRAEFLHQRFLASQGGLAAPGFTTDEAKRWENLAKALAQAELTIEHANAPATKAAAAKRSQALDDLAASDANLI